MQRRALMGLLLLLPVLFLTLVGLSSWMLGSSARMDLTDNRLYTLAPGTKEVLAALDEPVTLTIYFSDEATSELPSLRFFAERVRDLVTEMVWAADGQLQVEWVDPAPFSQAEDEALLAGLTALPIGPQDASVYFGASAAVADKDAVSIPLISPQREPLLEFELIQTIERVQRDSSPRLGLITDLPIQSGLVYEQLSTRFDLVEIPTSADQLASELDGVLVLHPKEINPALVDAVVAFMRQGGGVLLAIDPFIQSLTEPTPPAAELSGLLEALGLDIDLDTFVADSTLGLEVNLSPEGPPVRHPAIVGVGAEQMSSTDVVTSQLDVIHLATAGHWRFEDTKGLTFEPLLWSSQQSARLPTTRLETDVTGEQRVAQLSQELPARGERSVLAGRVVGDVNAIVVADVDFLEDRYWVARQQFLGTELTEAFAGNGAFVMNAADHLVGDARLIGIRSRDVAYRPFTLVDELRRLAEARLLATENRLSAALQEADQALSELRLEDPESMSDDDRAQLQAFVEKRLSLRQELRQVRRELDQDIEALTQRVTWINLLLMPAVVILWMGVARWRRTHRVRR
ncbi:MAG: GldG family protein [Wenzhouxiangella sp.]|nr:GldG family protein [Wenzhouxiangella sp.]